jgi:hypothetical protein
MKYIIFRKILKNSEKKSENFRFSEKCEKISKNLKISNVQKKTEK